MQAIEEKYPPLSEERMAIYKELIRNFTLMDDDFMSKVFEDKACAEYLLHAILDRDDLTVTEVKSQQEIKNLQGRSIRLDILATDETGKLYNIEVQRSDRGAVARRARYNSSLLDANITDPGDDYEDLCETYVIFITENDVLKRGKPIYHANRIVEETGEPLGDGAHIIYVNGQIRDDTRLGRLMHDFHCKDVADMTPSVLADRAGYFKENEEGSTNMCRAVEELIKREKLEEGRKNALLMLQESDLSYDKIAKFSNIPLEEVEELAKKHGL